MGESLEGFDASAIEPSQGAGQYTAIPVGEYRCIISKMEKKPTKANDGAYLSCTVEVVEGEHKGAKIFDIINLWNPSRTAVQIAEGTLSAICRCLGVITPRNTDELLNKPLRVEVGQDTYNGKVKNTIVRYILPDEPRESAKDPEANTAPSWMKR